MILRDAAAGDEPFLRRMLLLAAYRPGAEPPPVPDDVVERYIEGWGRRGDVGVMAEDGGRAVGAAWFRVFTADRPGHGFVAADIPELAIAVEPAARGRGVGHGLLAALIERAAGRGLRGLSLSVSTDNAAALELYRRIGFAPVRVDGSSLTMVRYMPA